MTMPEHLLRLLKDKGVITERGTSRVSRMRRCRRCRTLTLAGLDGNVLAMDADADLPPLTRRGDLLALVAGRVTYELGADGRLHYRSPRHVVHGPPTPSSSVHAAHRCGVPPPAEWLAPPPPPARQRQEIGF